MVTPQVDMRVVIDRVLALQMSTFLGRHMQSGNDMVPNTKTIDHI